MATMPTELGGTFEALHTYRLAVDGLSDLAGDPVRVRQVASTVQSTVYQLVDESGRRTVLKVSRDKESIQREMAVHSMLRNVVQVPGVLCGGVQGDVGWILFEDADLSATRWTRRRWAQVGRLTAALHQGLNLDAAQVVGLSLVSHTPPLKDVYDVVQSDVLGDALHQLRQTFRLSFRQFDALRDLLAGAGTWRIQDLADDLVWCHGDLHLRNILSSRSLRSLFIIDWAFLHRDVAYFDLFQTLDATSPTTPLRRFGSRLDVLRAYYNSRRIHTSFPRWVRGYARYASLHLWWILTRIAHDAEQGLHPRRELWRQTCETVAGLKALSGLHRSL